MISKKGMTMKMIVSLIIVLILLIAAGTLYYIVSGDLGGILDKLKRWF